MLSILPSPYNPCPLVHHNINETVHRSNIHFQAPQSQPVQQFRPSLSLVLRCAFLDTFNPSLVTHDINLLLDVLMRGGVSFDFAFTRPVLNDNYLVRFPLGPDSLGNSFYRGVELSGRPGQPGFAAILRQSRPYMAV
jgi:hypothetical protein